MIAKLWWRASFCICCRLNRAVGPLCAGTEDQFLLQADVIGSPPGREIAAHCSHAEGGTSRLMCSAVGSEAQQRPMVYSNGDGGVLDGKMNTRDCAGMGRAAHAHESSLSSSAWQ